MRTPRFWVPALLLILPVLLVAACSDDDPGQPAPGPGHPETPFPTTPDSLVSLYRTALAEMDTVVYPVLFGPDFRYLFSEPDMAANGLATAYMTRAEALRSAGNMFSGQTVVNSLGQVVPGVARIIVYVFDRMGEWEDAAGDSPFPGTQVARHQLRIHVERDFDLPRMSIIGDLDVFARQVERTDNQGNTRVGYQLAGLVDPDTLVAKSEIQTWGMGFFTYLDNEAPLVVFATRPTGTFPVPGFELDAQGSGDADSGLHHEAYRWRAAADSAWTGWNSLPLTRLTYADTGPMTVAVEVRDRWGLAARAESEITVPAAELPFPGTPDQLMANFRTIYDNRVGSLIDDVLHPDHETYLDAAAAAAYPQLGGVLTRAAELPSVTRLFAGEDVTDPEGNPVPAVGYVSFQILEPLSGWTVAGPERRVPGAQHATYAVGVYLHRWEADDLRVDGQVDFYAVARDSLHQGEIRDYWQLIAQDDLGAAGKVTVPVSWSGVKAMFRPE